LTCGNSRTADDDGARQEGQQGELGARLAVLRIEALAQALKLRHVDLLHIGEVRDLALGLLHLLRDLAAQADDRQRLLAQAQRVAAVEIGSTRRAGAAGGVGLQVLVRDAAGRSAALHELQLDAEFPGAASHRRAGDGLVVGGPPRHGRGA
jgi:hypothetical protein